MNKKTLVTSMMFVIAMLIFVIFSDNSVKNLEKAQQIALIGSQNQAIDKQKISLEQKIDVLKLEISIMNAALRHLESRFESLSSTANNSVASNLSLELTQDQTDDIKVVEEKVQQEANERFDEHIMALEINFSNESENQYWSEQKTGAIVAALDSLPAEILENVELKTTQCRSSMCRVEVEYYNETAQQEFEMQLPMLLGEDFPNLSAKHEQDEGISKSIYFLQSEEI